MGCGGSSFVLSRHYPEIIYVQKKKSSRKIEEAFVKPLGKLSDDHKAGPSNDCYVSRDTSETLRYSETAFCK